MIETGIRFLNLFNDPRIIKGSSIAAMGLREKDVSASVKAHPKALFLNYFEDEEESRVKCWMALVLVAAVMARRKEMWLHLRPSKGTRSLVRIAKRVEVHVNGAALEHMFVIKWFKYEGKMRLRS
ncbi:hypothetical protein Tco_0652930 [Tanacetum coccineum]|uniref:Uncharacterized protein n=1 Tax=Tanacetum coccineum TaxID=301880 RepID=A0ABQ4WZ09_9ASTR